MNKQGYKMTELGWVPVEWEVRELGNLAQHPIVYGIVQAGPHDEDGMPYIKSADVGGNIQVEQLSKTSYAIANKYKRSVVKPGDIVFSLRGNIGELSVVPPELKCANLTQGTARISVHPDDTEFIRQALTGSALKKTIATKAKGSTFQEISLEELRSLPIPYPETAPERKKIASILSTWDAAIEKETRLIAVLQTRHRALAQRLLRGAVRVKGFGDEWKEARLGDISKLKVGKTPSRSNERYWKEPNPQNIWVSISDMKASVVVDSKEKFSDLAVQECKPNKVLAGTLLMSFKLTLGRMAWAGKDLYTNEAIVAIYPDPTKALKELLFFILPLSVEQSDAGEAVKGKTLNQDHLQNLTFKIPSIEEQTAIAQILTASEQEIALHRHRLSALLKEKKGLMQALLTGRVRVKQI